MCGIKHQSRLTGLNWTWFSVFRWSSLPAVIETMDLPCTYRRTAVVGVLFGVGCSCSCADSHKIELRTWAWLTLLQTADYNWKRRSSVVSTRILWEFARGSNAEVRDCCRWSFRCIMFSRSVEIYAHFHFQHARWHGQDFVFKWVINTNNWCWWLARLWRSRYDSDSFSECEL